MGYHPNLALPAAPYRPGSQAKPTPVHVDGSETPLVRKEFREHLGLAAGLDLFNRGFFWEAHEVWESGWKASAGPERELLQGLIQLAGARLKQAMGNSKGADQLSERATGHLQKARSEGAIFCGIDLDRVVRDASDGTLFWLRRSRDLPATQSDIAVQPLELLYALDEIGIVQTCPSRTDYYSGNTLWLDRPPAEMTSSELANWRERCTKILPPDIRYRNFAWEREGLREPARELEGCEFNHFSVLRTREVQPRPVPPGVELRSLETDKDWDAGAALSIEINLPEIGPGVAPFTRWRYTSYRETVATLGGAFYGAFVDGELAGCLGIVKVGRGFRYQDVQTREAYRRRGIASALCTHAFLDMKRQGCDLGVIVAEPDSLAEKIYLSLGFERVSTGYYIRFKASKPEESAEQSTP